MEPNIEAFFQQLENDPDLQAVKRQLASLEAQIKPRVSEETWLLLLQWEAEWAQYLTLSAKRIYPLAYQAGLLAAQATTKPDDPSQQS